MLVSRTIHLTLLFRRHFFLQMSSNTMGRTVISRIESSLAKSSPAVADSPLRKDPVMADTSYDNKGFMMFGSISTPLTSKNVKSFSLPVLPSCTSLVDNNHQLMCSSNHLASPQTTTMRIEHKKFKRRSRIDLGLSQNSGDKCSVHSSNFENSQLAHTKKFSTTPYDESPQGSNYWEKKPASMNRPYNSLRKSNYDESHQGSNSWKKKPASVNSPYNSHSNSNYDESPQGSNSWKKKHASVNRPYNDPSNSNYAAVGHKLDAAVGSPMFKPFDICFSGRRNTAQIGTGENRECSIEMHEEGMEGGILRPGMVLLKNYITHDEQVEIVKVCREIGLGPGGFYQPGYANGAKLRLKMMCLGLDWDPQTSKYGQKRVIDGSNPPTIPNQFSELVMRAIQEAHSLIKKENRVWNEEDELPSMNPDICIVNFYSSNGRLGLHQDRDESRESLPKGLPVVSFSIGDSAEFLYGDERDAKKAESVFLESGDVLIFGGESRHVFHGVSSVLPNSAPKELLRDTCLCPGRLNLTFRQY